MQRVLSFQLTRNIDESSEYVTKRLCFSFLFSVGFLCLLCGFLLGRFAAKRSMEAQEQKARDELVENGLRKTEHLQQLALLELERASFDHDRATDRRTPDMMETDMRRINEFFSNLSFVHEVTNHATCVRATVRGSREPDRYVILSANGDGVAVALELGKVLDGIYSAHDWRPRRSLIFCLSLIPSDVCSQTLSAFMRQKVMAYVAVHGRLTRANDQVTLFGSDVMRSIAVEAVKTIPGDRDWAYLDLETFGPRLFLNIPQVVFSYNDSNAYSQTHRNQSLRLRYTITTLAQMVSQTIWRLSESIVIRWEPKYFNETVNVILGSIDTSKFRDAKEKLKRTLKVLLAAVEDLNAKIDITENTQALRVRIWNDLLLDLDKALLCPDENSHSRTDLTTLRKLSLETTSGTLTYLDEMTKCYEDAIQILQER